MLDYKPHAHFSKNGSENWTVSVAVQVPGGITLVKENDSGTVVDTTREYRLNGQTGGPTEGHQETFTFTTVSPSESTAKVVVKDDRGTTKGTTTSLAINFDMT